MAKNFEVVEHQSINLIGVGTTINGEIKSNGDIRIDGTLTGKVHSKGKVVVGNTGVIEGEIYCQNADFSGTINAKVEVLGLLTLKASTKLKGDVNTNKLAIEPGAKFTGTCNMDKALTQEPLPLSKDNPKSEIK